MIDLGLGVTLVTRNEWLARPPRNVVGFNPVTGSTSHWEGPHMGNFSHFQCAYIVRAIQNYHMDKKGWSDIAYTAVACPHGYVFEGRWIGVRTAANGTIVGNSSAYAVCYLGGVGDDFTEEGKRAMRVAQDFLQVHGGAGARRNSHSDWKATLCPGPDIRPWVEAGQPLAPITSQPPEEGNWFEMATKEEFKQVMREVLAEPILGTKYPPLFLGHLHEDGAGTGVVYACNGITMKRYNLTGEPFLVSQYEAMGYARPPGSSDYYPIGHETLQFYEQDPRIPTQEG